MSRPKGRRTYRVRRLARVRDRLRCWDWGHLPAGGCCARCGADTTRRHRRPTVRDVVWLCIFAVAAGLLIGHALMPLDLSR